MKVTEQVTLTEQAGRAPWQAVSGRALAGERALPGLPGPGCHITSGEHSVTSVTERPGPIWEGAGPRLLPLTPNSPQSAVS